MNQTEAARRIGVHFVTIYAWENERRGDQPSDANLARAAKVYRTSAEELKRRAAAIEKTLGTAKSAAASTNGSADGVAANPAPNAVSAASASAGAAKRQAPAKRAAPPAPRDRPARTAAVASTTQGSADRAVVSKVLRVLADVADKVPLTPETLNAAQRALLAPAFIDVFAAFKSGPMSDEDINAAFDATGAAVVGFVERRGLVTR